jgi:hypothetical protein
MFCTFLSVLKSLSFVQSHLVSKERERGYKEYTFYFANEPDKKNSRFIMSVAYSTCCNSSFSLSFRQIIFYTSRDVSPAYISSLVREVNLRLLTTRRKPFQNKHNLSIIGKITLFFLDSFNISDVLSHSCVFL